MSKAVKAVEIFNEVVGKNPTEASITAKRSEIIERFVKELPMSRAGSNTYFATTKKKVMGGTTATKAKPKSTTHSKPNAKYSEKGDPRDMYTIVSKEVNDDGKEVVAEEQECFFDIDRARKALTSGQKIVKGFPDAGTAWSKVKAVK